MKKTKISDLVKEAGVMYGAGSASSEMALLRQARAGISKKSLMNIAEAGGLSLKEISTLLPVSLRTIQRYSDADLLDPSVSEHALQIAEVISKGSGVFDTLRDLQQWLHTPNPALGSETPLSLLDTSFGARVVIDELGRLDYGVYS